MQDRRFEELSAARDIVLDDLDVIAWPASSSLVVRGNGDNFPLAAGQRGDVI
jgi:hypothetical protein